MTQSAENVAACTCNECGHVKCCWCGQTNPYVVGNDGLTAAERAGFLDRFNQGIGSRVIPPDEGPTWFRETPEALRLLAEETRLLEESEGAELGTLRATVARAKAETHASEYGGPCRHEGSRADCRICPPTPPPVSSTGSVSA